MSEEKTMRKLTEEEERLVWKSLFASSEFIEEIKAADAAPPEAAFNNVEDMLAWLNDTPRSVRAERE